MALGSAVDVDCLRHRQIHDTSHNIRHQIDCRQERVFTETAERIGADVASESSLQPEDKVPSPQANGTVSKAHGKIAASSAQ